jgi:hypothetical protein
LLDALHGSSKQRDPLHINDNTAAILALCLLWCGARTIQGAVEILRLSMFNFMILAIVLEHLKEMADETEASNIRRRYTTK